MIPINGLVGIFGCIICVIGMVSLALLIRAHSLYTRALDILVVAYDWLEQHRQEAEKREGTD